MLIYKNNELLACAGLKDCKEGHTGEIYSLAVKKDKQNTGLSTKLLDKIIEKAKTEGFVKVFALVGDSTITRFLVNFSPFSIITTNLI